MQFPLGKKFKIQVGDLTDVLAVWPALVTFLDAARHLTIDDDGDGQAVEVEAGEAAALLTSALGVATALKKLNPIQRSDAPTTYPPI